MGIHIETRRSRASERVPGGVDVDVIVDVPVPFTVRPDGFSRFRGVASLVLGDDGWTRLDAGADGSGWLTCAADLQRIAPAVRPNAPDYWLAGVLTAVEGMAAAEVTEEATRAAEEAHEEWAQEMEDEDRRETERRARDPNWDKAIAERLARSEEQRKNTASTRTGGAS